MNTRTLNPSEFTFDASAQTITFSVAPDSVVTVINNTLNNQTLFNFACADFSATVVGLVLTFIGVDTTAMSDGDTLTIIIEERGQDVSNIDFRTGARQIVDFNGSAKVGEAIILVGDAFGGKTPNVLQWDTEFVGSGASVVLPGTQRLETGTTSDSEARFQSTKAARFMISQFNIYHGGIFLDNISDPDCKRSWGGYNPIAASPNGLFFRLDGGNWFIGSVKNGVETLVPEANWNGSGLAAFNDTPGLSVYEIQYNAGSAFFFQGRNLIHVLSVAAGGTYADSYNFKVSLEVINSNGNTTNNGIEFRAHGTYRLGEERGETISRAFTSDTLIKTGAGYCEHVYLSRTGSGGGSAILTVYDGINNSGIVMKRIDVGSDDYKGGAVKSTFSDGLFIEISGSGTVTADLAFE